MYEPLLYQFVAEIFRIVLSKVGPKFITGGEAILGNDAIAEARLVGDRCGREQCH